METLAVILCFLSMLAIIGVIVLLIYSIIKKNFKLRPKKLLLILLGCIVFFIGTMIFYGIVQTPETKAKVVANQKAKAEEQAKKEQEEKEKKLEEDKLKQESQQNKEEVKSTEDAKKEENNEIKAEINNEEKTKVDDRFTLTTEPNTSAAVDELILKGKKDSKNATKDNIKEAIKFINDNYNKYWTNNEIMQKTMYYGALLEYSNEDKIIKELGLDSEQVVKYIYRKAEKVEDSATQSNLEQIKKSLDKIPSSLK